MGDILLRSPKWTRGKPPFTRARVGKSIVLEVAELAEGNVWWTVRIKLGPVDVVLRENDRMADSVEEAKAAAWAALCRWLGGQHG